MTRMNTLEIQRPNPERLLLLKSVDTILDSVKTTINGLELFYLMV